MSKKTLEDIFPEIVRNEVLELIYILEAQIKAMGQEVAKAKTLLEPAYKFQYDLRRANEQREVGELKSAIVKKTAQNARSGKLLTVVDVAEILSVSPATVKSYIKTGKLAGIKLPGGEYRFKPEHIDGWLNKRTLKARSF